jgi:hypothetical protein
MLTLYSASSLQSIQSESSVHGQKRKHGETEGDETDEESALERKKRWARGRSSALKTVKASSSVKTDSESGLPTPDVTGGEEGDRDEVDQIRTEGLEADISDEDDLEREMMAEFERADQEAGGDGGG